MTLRPSLRGGSGMLELGCSLQSFQHSPLNLDLGLSGWAGKQEGAAFHANIKWQF